MKQKRGPLSIALIVIAIAVGIVLKNNRSADRKNPQPGREQTDNRRPGNDQKDVQDPANHPRRDPDRPSPDGPASDLGFDRHHGDGKLVFTKHARCRMGCRHIDESEVREILEKGTVNPRKSEPAARPDPKFAVEGHTRDGQQVRIIFAPASRGMVVITVIDLDNEWTCDCR
ncbi:DUF4258 domain-containing protein [Paraflavitalea pollutisoli]|uniref:DUF4258 domain-containing protein n=1 Tax=Paraflavitalea pollutisoli TaxID=3034143 RepID=UPI0023ED7E3D|nr:DUF4258 domain-containing protein [Paraflavitalea sp. H1-2-19X]